LVLWSQIQETPAPAPPAVVHRDTVIVQAPTSVPAESILAPKVVPHAGTPLRLAPLRPDTNVLRQLKPPAVPSDTAVLQQAFDRLANAISTEDVNAVQASFPNMPDTERAWFVSFFARAANIRVKTRTYDALTIRGDTADVVVALHVGYRNKNAAEPSSLVRKYRATAARADGGWKITTLIPESR
jgi:hypothetical protein